MHKVSIGPAAQHPQGLIVESEAIEALGIEPAAGWLINRDRRIEPISIAARRADGGQSGGYLEGNGLTGAHIERIEIGLALFFDASGVKYRRAGDCDGGFGNIVGAFGFGQNSRVGDLERQGIGDALGSYEAQRVAPWRVALVEVMRSRTVSRGFDGLAGVLSTPPLSTETWSPVCLMNTDEVPLRLEPRTTA